MNITKRPVLLRLDLPHGEIGPASTAANGLRLLLEAYHCVRELSADEWEFAVEIGCLQAAGLTNTSLRWLLHQRYVRHGVERTESLAPQRIFHHVENLSLPQNTCFVLTDAGADYARMCLEAEVESAHLEVCLRPVWDAVRRELRVGSVVVKQFKQPAVNQELVLSAFEEEGWPPRIDDPLPPEPEQDPKRRLHSTISNLNRGQRSGIRVHFSGGGEGESICWCVLGRAKTGRSQNEGSERKQG